MAACKQPRQQQRLVSMKGVTRPQLGKQSIAHMAYYRGCLMLERPTLLHTNSDKLKVLPPIHHMTPLQLSVVKPQSAGCICCIEIKPCIALHPPCAQHHHPCHCFPTACMAAAHHSPQQSVQAAVDCAAQSSWAPDHPQQPAERCTSHRLRLVGMQVGKVIAAESRLHTT